MSEPKRKQVQSKNETAKAQQVEKQQVEQAETAVSAHPALQRALADPSDITPNDAKILQRTFGNRAVRSFILQRKMTVGPVGDKYEQEADAVAKQVVQAINTPKVPPVQRQEEDDELQMKPFPTAIPLPTISTLQRQIKPFKSNLPPFPFLHKKEESDLQAKGNSMLTGGDLSGDLESSVQQAKSGGQPLGDGLRGPMEQAFNADFSGVKVHTDSQSDTLNRSISARAFTTGSDIFFRDGEYNPASSAGKTLIAHELTHTIQQGAATVQRATHQPHTISPADARHRQRTVGNQTIGQVARVPSAGNGERHSLQRMLSAPAGIIQRDITVGQRRRLKQLLGRNKAKKVKDAGKEDEYVQKSDRELSELKGMQNTVFDTMLTEPEPKQGWISWAASFLEYGDVEREGNVEREGGGDLVETPKRGGAGSATVFFRNFPHTGGN